MEDRMTAAAARRWLAGRVEAARRWFARRRSYHEVMRLDDRLLRDIGLTREDIREAFRAESAREGLGGHLAEARRQRREVELAHGLDAPGPVLRTFSSF